MTAPRTAPGRSAASSEIAFMSGHACSPGRQFRLDTPGTLGAADPAGRRPAPDQVTEFDDPVKRGVSPHALLYLITAGPGGCARSWPRGALNAGWPGPVVNARTPPRSEEHTPELQSLRHLVCRLLLQ